MTTLPNLDHYWLPFTANRQFKSMPRLYKAARGNWYTTIDDRPVLDATAGLWCVAAGHGREEIADAVAAQLRTLDYAPAFQSSHPLAFAAAEKLAAYVPPGLDRVFFTDSGSESVDTALKIALAYHRVRGDPLRQKLIGRERAYHGVNFGGLAVGGIAGNRKLYGNGLPGVDHIRHPLDLARNAFTRGQPAAGGAALAAEFEARITTVHDPATVAALIVEPIQGSTGVILPPQGYLQGLREICDRHGILLIFDEVITGFGRLGARFAADRFGVVPDLITCAKGLTNGAIPMGAVLVKREIHDAFMAAAADNAIELPHGYTYSGHPVACAAALATLDIFATEKLEQRAASLEEHFADCAHALRGAPFVRDIRNLGLVAGIELEAAAGKAGLRGFATYLRCFELGVNIRFTGDILAISPPLTIERGEVEQIFATVARALTEIAAAGDAGLELTRYCRDEQQWAAHQLQLKETA